MTSLNVALSQNDTIPQREITKLELRQFDGNKLADYHSDDDYNYDAYRDVQEGAFQRFLNRVWRWFRELFSSGPTGRIMEIALYVIAFGVLVFLIVKLTGMEATAFFRKARTGDQDFEISEESLDQINFEEEIAKAKSEKQWRIAIRLIYLYSLKTLADRQMIFIKKGKTNHEYLYELEDKEWKEDFSSLCFIFDYTWYGHFEGNEELVKRAESNLMSIQKQERAA